MEWMMAMAFAGAAGIAAVAAMRDIPLREASGAMRLPGEEGRGIPFAVRLLIAGAAPFRGWAMRCASSRRKAATSRLIEAAGLGFSIDAGAFHAACGLGVACGAIIALVLFGCSPESLAFGTAIAWVVMTGWLRKRAARRRQAIELALPGALDWLTLSVEAGEGFLQALGRISAALPAGPLKDELCRFHADLRTGMSRRAALAALARRAGVPSLSSVVALLIQADALGTSIGPVLRVSSQRLRAERLARAERRGVAAAQKALVPLVLCIMPATFIVVFGPLVARLLTGGIEALLR